MTDLLTDTIAVLESLSHRAQDLAATLPHLDLDPATLAHLAGQAQRIAGRLADLEEALGQQGPVATTEAGRRAG